MAKPFETETITVRALLNTDFNESVLGLNYFIPPYQRNYAWSKFEVQKLITDIHDMIEDKDDGKFKPYFIGGIVLSEESILGKDRTSKSFEVIDGQQRLTTLILLTACLIQQLKNQKKKFTNTDAISFIINELEPLISSSSLNRDTYKIEHKFKVERSDRLKDKYELILQKLVNETILDFSSLDDLAETNEEKNLINVVKKINECIEDYEEKEFLDFIGQLLKYTYVVITTTKSTETGFLIFEKLNDSGISLEPQDLLKNYLFSNIIDDTFDLLSEKWNILIDTIKDINITKSQFLTREFLEHYLTSTGFYLRLDEETKKKEKVFQKFKIIYDEFNDPINLIDDLTKLAKEYKEIKRSGISLFLNTINFKLGYLIFLSFFKKYGNNYTLYINEIATPTLKIGIVYLLINKSKDLSYIIPELCNTIINKGETIQETINIFKNKVQNYFDDKDYLIKNRFYETILNNNLFIKKPLTIMLMRILNYHFSKVFLDFNLKLQHIMPQDYNSIKKCNYLDIDEENYPNYINQIGNLIIIDKSYPYSEIPYCYDAQFEYYNSFENKDSIFSTNIIPMITKIVWEEKEDLNPFIKTYNSLIKNKSKGWGKELITERSEALAKTIVEIVILKDNFDKNFFDFSSHLVKEYFIYRNKYIDAKMIINENKCKVLKGSKCNIKEPHKNYGWNDLRNKLLDENVLINKQTHLEFTKDYNFDSPSAAASIVLARQSPGPIDWKNEFNIPLKELS